MGRIEKRVCIVVLAAFLLALGAMLLQDLLAGDAPRIYHITILLDGSDEAYWQSFRLGADRPPGTGTPMWAISSATRGPPPPPRLRPSGRPGRGRATG